MAHRRNHSRFDDLKRIVFALSLVFALNLAPLGAAQVRAESLVSQVQTVQPNDTKDGGADKGEDKKEDGKKDKDGGGGVIVPTGDGSSY